MVCQRQLSILFIQNFVITFFQVRPQRSSTNSKAKLTRHPSYNEAIRGRVSSNMTKYASSPKLTIPANAHATPSHLNQHNHGSVYNLGGSMSSKATSMVNLKAKKNSLEEKLKKHLPLRKNQSAPMSESNSNTARSRKVRNIFKGLVNQFCKFKETFSHQQIDGSLDFIPVQFQTGSRAAVLVQWWFDGEFELFCQKCFCSFSCVPICFSARSVQNSVGYTHLANMAIFTHCNDPQSREKPDLVIRSPQQNQPSKRSHPKGKIKPNLPLTWNCPVCLILSS